MPTFIIHVASRASQMNTKDGIAPTIIRFTFKISDADLFGNANLYLGCFKAASQMNTKDGIAVTFIRFES